MKDFIDNLNQRHKTYLDKEGKWLGGGFENVFQFDKHEKAIDLKLEVFSMLPKEIKEEILDSLKDRT